MPSRCITLSNPSPIATREQFTEALGIGAELIEQVTASPVAWYSEFVVPKASGGVRTIRPPRKQLRCVQRTLLRILYSRLKVPPYLHGGVPKRSIITHAKAHIGRLMVATLDVRNFFPSTKASLVQLILEHAGIVDEALDDALALTMLDDGLPQGAPTSSFLANLAFGPVDAAIIALCRKRRLSYSRYVDDIALSGNANFRELKGPLVDRIRVAGFDIAEEKIRFMLSSSRQVVTGLVVNAKLRPTSEFVEHLKNDIRLCLQHGPAVLADIEGVPTRAIKLRLTGRVAHLSAVDARSGKRLRGMLCGVTWSQGQSVS